MKKKILLSSILSIVLCLSLIAGSTFALFTDSISVNVTVSSGLIDLEASLGDLYVWSRLEEEPTVPSTEYNFVNGGLVTKGASDLTIERMTPGDNVKAIIAIKNNSDIAIKYRVVMSAAESQDADFVEALDGIVTVDGVEYAMQGSSTAWFDLGAYDAIDDFAFHLYLPDDVDSTMMGKSAKLTITIEAVQFDGIVPAATANELTEALANAHPGDTIALDPSVDYGMTTIDGTLEDVVIDTYGANVYFTVASTAVLENVTFTNMNGDGLQRAIDIAADSTVKNLTITNSKFADNDATPYGALYTANADAEISIVNCVFEDCKYAMYGSTPAAKLSFENCTFKNFSSWVVLLNGGDTVGAQLTINNCTFENCVDGIAKYLGSSQPEGAFTVFTNNTLTNCKGHDGVDSKWFTIPGATDTITVSGNTLDGADWTPGTAQGLGK